MGKSNGQALANTAWSFVKSDQDEELLLVALAGTAKQSPCDFNAQALACTAWALAKLDQAEELRLQHGQG